MPRVQQLAQQDFRDELVGVELRADFDRSPLAAR